MSHEYEEGKVRIPLFRILNAFIGKILLIFFFPQRYFYLADLRLMGRDISHSFFQDEFQLKSPQPSLTSFMILSAPSWSPVLVNGTVAVLTPRMVIKNIRIVSYLTSSRCTWLYVGCNYFKKMQVCRSLHGTGSVQCQSVTLRLFNY